MKKVTKLQKIIIIIIYALLIFTYFSMCIYGSFTPGYFTFMVDDAIFPLGGFILFTIIQAIVYHTGKNEELVYGLNLVIAPVKGASVIIIDFIMDFFNLHFNSLYSVLVLLFLIAVALSAIVETIFASKLLKDSKPTDKEMETEK